MTPSKQPEASASIKPSQTPTPFLSIHGNVRYDFLYRSYVDTPFAQRDFQQHTIQTYLNILVQDRYPLKMNLTNRNSNSPFFRDFTDVGVQFDRNAYVQRARQQLLSHVEKHAFQKPEFKALTEAVQRLTQEYSRLQMALSNPGVLQRQVEENEKSYYRNFSLSRNDSTVGNSMQRVARYWSPRFKFSQQETPVNSTVGVERRADVSVDQAAQLKKRLDSLAVAISTWQARADSVKDRLTKDLALVKRNIYKAEALKELDRIGAEQGLKQKYSSGVDAFLTGVKTIGVGRSVLNYSELTAQNVMLTGLNLEYNPRMYAALAVGKVDFGFRDFLGHKKRQQGQFLLMGRVGVGDKDHKAVIFSAFTGRKYNYGSGLYDTVSSHVQVIGYSVEGLWKKDEYTSFSAEVAKTTKPTGGRNQVYSLSSLTKFGDYSNLGVSLHGKAMIKQTNTRFNGMFKKTGGSFQSFSLFTYNTDQTSWLLKVDQSISKDKVTLAAALRRNDFSNPFAEKTFKASTLFKSVQAYIRVPKYPVVSVGYYPGTQLYFVDKEQLRENAYYILNGSVVHAYSLGVVRMLSSLVYNHYFSQGTDSGFVSYKGINYIASHSIAFTKLQLQATYAFTDQQDWQYGSLSAGGDLALSKSIKIGAGNTYSKVKGGGAYWGSNARLSIEAGALGTLQMHYEKSFLPTIYRSLYPVETGRVTWFKYF